MTSTAPKPEPTADEVLENALKLSREQRTHLAEQLLKSIDGGDVEGAWAEEIVARVEALERGEVELIDAREVFAHARARLAR